MAGMAPKSFRGHRPPIKSDGGEPRTAAAATPTSPVADVLNGAADLIERDGWVQGAAMSAGRRCALKALFDAASGANQTYWDARSGLMSVTGGWVAEWQDRTGRTKAEVVAALRAAAEQASA